MDLTQKRFYSESELIAFGHYLLSEARKRTYKENPHFKTKRLKERLSVVNDADVQNFKALIA